VYWIIRHLADIFHDKKKYSYLSCFPMGAIRSDLLSLIDLTKAILFCVRILNLLNLKSGDFWFSRWLYTLLSYKALYATVFEKSVKLSFNVNVIFNL
jgi:hypothetical protein